MCSILGLPDEGRDALMRAALDPPARALESWRQWERSRRDARTDPVARRWVPLVGHNLRDTPVDPPARALFAEARREAWASNLRLFDAARPALEALAASGIPTMLLKGAVVARAPYAEPGLRPIGDVDVLVDPAHARASMRILEELGWVAWRGYSERDVLLGHGLDFRKPPHGALDLHWYLLAECCWTGADRGLWQRGQPMTSVTATTVVPAPPDLLLHFCVHGLRWSPVHAAHWIADAVRVIHTAGGRLDWEVIIEEAAGRRLGLQMAQALLVVRDRGHADIPQAALNALERQPVSWRDRLECRLKGRPVVSAGGLFVIWAAWRRTGEAIRAAGRRPPSWWRFLGAALGAATPAALARKLAAHGWARARAVVHRPPRSLSSRTRIVSRG